MTLKSFRSIAIAVLSIAVLPSAVSAATHTLEWDRNAETDVAGYTVHYGLAPGVYTGTVDVHNNLSWEFTIPDGQRYYLAVKAYTGNNMLSPYSVEVTVLDTPAPPVAPALSVTSVAPMNGAVGIPSTMSVAIAFNKPVNPSSVTSATVELLTAGNGHVAATVFYDPTTQTVTIDPVARLVDGNVYTAIARIGVTAVSGESLTANYTWSFTTGIVAAGDFTGDGRPDLLWRHQTAGHLAAWSMNGLNSVGTSWLTPRAVEDPAWEMAGTGDFNQDGHLDILWHHKTARSLVVWFMDRTVATSTGKVNTTMPDTDWSVKAVVDFNGDGQVDILWQNAKTAALAVWTMAGTTAVAERWLDTSGLSDKNWQVVGARDLNQDGRPDLLWQHKTAPALSIWLMEGFTQRGAMAINTSGIGDAHWRVKSLIDLDLDGHVDLVWQHGRDGSLAAWFMRNGILQSSNFLAPKSAGDIAWQVAAPR